jgi:LacI family transcriptional regulator
MQTKNVSSRSPGSGPVTTQDIAAFLGIARPTVSTILSGCKSNTRVSDKLRKKVMQAAAELGYRPNTAAQAIKRGTFDAIGIISSSESGRGGMPWATLYALQQQAASHDMHLSMGIIPDGDLTDPAGLPKVVREWCVDGLLISYTSEIPPVMSQHIERHRIPAIWMNVKRDHDCVYLDDFGAARGATELLLERGHRRIAFFGHAASSAHYSTADRYDGYAVTMTKAGLSPHPLFRPDVRAGEAPEPGTQIQPLIELLRGDNRPTAIVTVGRETDVVFAAYQLGLSVPRDLSIINISEGAGPALGLKVAEMRLHTYGMGWRAFDVLQRKIEQPESPLEAVSIYCTFDPGQTLAPPRAER